METLGHHLILDLYECPTAVLDDLEFLRRELLEAVRLSGATIITDVFHKFSPQGVTGVVVIAESHASIHTWPEKSFAAIDLFTCGSAMKVDLAISHLVTKLQAARHTVRDVSRGSDACVVPLPTVLPPAVPLPTVPSQGKLAVKPAKRKA